MRGTAITAQLALDDGGTCELRGAGTSPPVSFLVANMSTLLQFTAHMHFEWGGSQRRTKPKVA